MSEEQEYINSRQPGWREENELEKQIAESSLAAVTGSVAGSESETCERCDGTGRVEKRQPPQNEKLTQDARP